MIDDKKPGCELGRSHGLRIQLLEAQYKELKTEVATMHREILDKLNTWMPKTTVIAFSTATGIIAALITAIAMLLTR